MTTTPDSPFEVVAVSAGVSSPSTTRMLADRIGVATREQLAALLPGAEVRVRVVELRELASDIAIASTGALKSERLNEAIATVARADALIAVTPVFKASYTGLFKSFFDVLDDDVLLSMPVVLAATAGTPRHALVPDSDMRPLFAYLRAMAVPTSVFAATEDWADPAGLGRRIKRAATELAALTAARVRQEVLGRQGSTYQRTFDSHGSQDSLADIDFDTDLMRLATGGVADKSPRVSDGR
ncbi:hypothetical protein GCM10010401_19370 [Rarobacter faecitabidus]|uniref:FMN reductase n=1 Tax=Rarobacter faecitabidus TaxID=13243 RepID=A0A542ZUW4_RARFA|nr:CE1759 family FMN reductase [Rarobacter faecitabidus]TQL64144.1 FMN reductase [Rarobacter faecitabidus]